MTTEITQNKSANVRAFEFDDHVATLAEGLNLPMDIDIDVRMNRAIDKTNQALRLVIEAGVDFIKIKQELPHGEFGEWLLERGVSPRRAQEAMAIAHLTASLPSKDRNEILSMSKSKAMLIAHADPEVITELVEETEGEDITDLNQLSFRKLRERIRELESAKADLEVENETKSIAIKTLNDRAAGARNFNNDFPDFVNVTRDEANALSTEISLRLDELERLLSELADLPTATSPSMVSIAATHLDIHLKGLAARSAQLCNQLYQTFGGVVTELNGDHTLSEAEMENAIRDRHTMIQELEQQQRIREDRREAAKPRKPGRPKKSSNE